MPGMSLKSTLSNGAGMSLGCQVVMPFGLSILQAILANWRLAARPIEHVMWGPTWVLMRSWISLATPTGSF